MYKISVPIYNTNVVRCDREEILKQLKRFNAERVFLALDRYELDETKKTKALKELRDNCEFFKNQGFEVGAWIWTFWIAGNKNFRNMRSIRTIWGRTFFGIISLTTDHLGTYIFCQLLKILSIKEMVFAISFYVLYLI